jgi:type IV secretion system protein VirB8
MFGKNKQDASKGDGGNAPKSVNFEISIADIARRSEKRAWIVTMVSMLMSLILAGGYFYMLPLKKIEPYMIMADAYTGNLSVAKLEGDYAFKTLSTQEAIQKSNVTHYIVARESYDYVTTRERDWQLVHLMSEGTVSESYIALYDANNPQAPANVYGRERSLRVEILSVQLRSRGTPEKPIYEASVRFQRNILDKRTGQTRLLDNKTATLEFVYNSNLALTDKQRVDNPLGFRVISYRVDSDASDAPVVAPPTNVLPQDQAAQFGVGQIPNQALPGTTLPGQPLPGQPTIGALGQPMPAQPATTQPAPNQQVPATPQFGAPAAAPQPTTQPPPNAQSTNGAR